MNTLMIVILVLFIGSLVFGVYRNVNIGPLTMTISLVVGCGLMGLKLADVLQYVPVRVLFYIVSVTMFYGIAQANGTLAKLAEHVVYRGRKIPGLMPAIFFLLTVLIAYLGVGIFAGAFLAPLYFKMGEKANINPLLTYTCVNCGAIVGSNMPQSLGGLVIQDLIYRSPYMESAMEYTVSGTIYSAVVCVMMVLLAHLIFRNRHLAVEEFVQPAPFDTIQKKNLLLILVISSWAIFGPVVLKLLPHRINQALSFLSDIGVLFTISTVAAVLLNVGDEKESIRKYVPWTTVVQLTGITCLLGVSTETGVIDQLSQYIISLPGMIVIPLLALLAGFMSMFASGVAVVCPTLFPVVPVVAPALGISPAILYAGIWVGASVTGTSPFSTSGSTILSSYGTPEEQNKFLYKVLLIPILMLTITLVTILVWALFP